MFSHEKILALLTLLRIKHLHRLGCLGWEGTRQPRVRLSGWGERGPDESCVCGGGDLKLSHSNPSVFGFETLVMKLFEKPKLFFVIAKKSEYDPTHRFCLQKVISFCNWLEWQCFCFCFFLFAMWQVDLVLCRLDCREQSWLRAMSGCEWFSYLN